jgi:hypothetical protein
MSKKKTQEFQGMPEMDSAGKLATKLAGIDDVITEKKTERDSVALQLSEVLEMTGRTKIQLDDRVYTLKETKASKKIVAVKRKDAPPAATHASKTAKD